MRCNYNTKLWTIFSRLHMSPRWGLLLGWTPFLYTCRPAGACSLDGPRFYTHVAPNQRYECACGIPRRLRLFAHLPLFLEVRDLWQIQRKTEIPLETQLSRHTNCPNFSYNTMDTLHRRGSETAKAYAETQKSAEKPQQKPQQNPTGAESVYLFLGFTIKSCR